MTIPPVNLSDNASSEPHNHPSVISQRIFRQLTAPNHSAGAPAVQPHAHPLANPWRRHPVIEKSQGDISIELTQGTFLTSLDKYVSRS